MPARVYSYIGSEKMSKGYINIRKVRTLGVRGSLHSYSGRSRIKDMDCMII